MATITTLKSGDYTDTTVWSTGTVPVDGDKVTISKLGTATSRVTSSAISAGSGNVPVTSGTGTGLIGEVIEFDSRPGEYYELTTGFTASAGTAVVTPVLAGAIASGATLRNRGHKVVLLGTRVAGDDTSTGVTVNGVLYWDRAANASLQVKGTYTVSATGTEDRGTAVDPITSVNATLLCNYSAAMAVGKYSYSKASGGRIKHYGKARTRKTRIVGAITAGSTLSFDVDDATGWEIGDSITIVPTNPGVSATIWENKAISGISGNTVTVGSTYGTSKLARAYIANLTSNINSQPQNMSFGHLTSWAAGTIALDVDVFHSLIEGGDCGSAGGTAGGFGCTSSSVLAARITSSVIKNKHQIFTAALSGSPVPPLLDSCITYSDATAGFLYVLNVNGAKYINGAVLGVGQTQVRPIQISSGGVLGTVTGNVFAALSQSVGFGGAAPSIGTFADNDILDLYTGASGGTGLGLANPGAVSSRINFDPFGTLTTRPPTNMSAASGVSRLESCKFPAEPLITYGSNPACRLTSTYATGRSNSRTHEIWDNEGYAYSDTATRNRGDAALNVTNRTTSPFVYTFTAAIANGETKRVIGYLRRNATYAAGSMPTITLSIPGVTSVVSSATDSADTWHKVDLSITNTTGSTQEVTVTMSANGAANASSSAWFDGIPIYPFVQGVRHYGFVFDESNPFRVVNPVTVASEITASAYTGVTINSATPSITVGAGTADTWQKVYDYGQAWGVLNLDKTVLMTSADGQTFSLALTTKLSWPGMPGDRTLSGGWLLLATTGVHSYRLSGTKIEFQTAGTYNMSDTVFSGTVELVNTSGGAVTVSLPSGTSYTNTGPSITVTTPTVIQSVTVNGLVSGSLVQVYDTTTAVELANGTSTTTFSWTDSAPASGSRDIRVRIAYCVGTDARQFIEAAIGTCGTTSGTEALTYLAAQTNDTVYNANAIDGSTVTGITISDGIDRMLINIAGGSVAWSQVYAYNVYWLSTTAGIRDDGAIMTATDTANYTVSGFLMRNTSSVPLSITGGYGRDAATGTVASLIDVAGSTGNIYQTPDHVVAYATGSGLSPAESAQLMALPSASAIEAALIASVLPVDVQMVNGISIAGTGTEANPWGPA